MVWLSRVLLQTKMINEHACNVENCLDALPCFLLVELCLLRDCAKILARYFQNSTTSSRCLGSEERKGIEGEGERGGYNLKPPSSEIED
jgi:hypothetical protein